MDLYPFGNTLTRGTNGRAQWPLRQGPAGDFNSLYLEDLEDLLAGIDSYEVEISHNEQILLFLPFAETTVHARLIFLELTVSQCQATVYFPYLAEG